MAASISHLDLFWESSKLHRSCVCDSSGEAAWFSSSMMNLESSRWWKYPSLQPHLPQPVRRESSLNTQTLLTVVTQDPPSEKGNLPY